MYELYTYLNLQFPHVPNGRTCTCPHSASGLNNVQRQTDMKAGLTPAAAESVSEKPGYSYLFIYT